jgi:hypothetical protein
MAPIISTSTLRLDAAEGRGKLLKKCQSEEDRCTCGHLENRHRWDMIEVTDAPGFVYEVDAHICFVKNCKCTHYTPQSFVDGMRRIFEEAMAGGKHD